MSRRWRVRAVQFVAVLVAAFVVLTVLERDPEPLRLGLLVILACTATWLAFDLLASTTVAPDLGIDADVAPHEGAVDPRTDTLTRMIDAHQQSRHHDRELHTRLTAVVDQRLARARGLRRDRDRAEVHALLGAEVVAVLDDPSRRLTLSDIETTLNRIEAL